MSKQNVEEKNFTIKWFMAEDKIIKFEEVEETFDVSDAVAGFDFEKMGVKAGSKVAIKIDRDQGDHGVVVFMKKDQGGNNTSNQSSSTAKKFEIKTVKAYGTKFDGSLLFTDSDTWYSCNKSIGVDNLSQYKDKDVEIITSKGPKGGNYVTSIKFMGNQTTTPTTTTNSQVKNNYSNNNDSRQVSIEAQACMNHANIAVSTLFAGKFDANSSSDGVLVKSLIKSIAKNNWDIVQELKIQG